VCGWYTDELKVGGGGAEQFSFSAKHFLLSNIHVHMLNRNKILGMCAEC